jgi:hypothetical protein
LFIFTSPVVWPVFPQPEFVFVFVDFFGISQGFPRSTVQGIGNPPGDSKLFFRFFPIFFRKVRTYKTLNLLSGKGLSCFGGAFYIRNPKNLCFSVNAHG